VEHGPAELTGGSVFDQAGEVVSNPEPRRYGEPHHPDLEVTMRIKDVLESKGSTTVITIAPGATVRELVDLLATHNIGAVVVSEDGAAPAGIVSERDVVRRVTEDGLMDRPVSEIMTTEVQVCEPGDLLDDLMGLMTEHRIRHVPVLDDGVLIGLVSIGDAVKVRMRELEFERDQLNDYVTRSQ
jgi:CBS domain-containing protein